MQSVGETLRHAREELGYTVREVSIQTTIGTKYLNALEEDNYDVFPSETHITGFIRNYSQFLELNPDEMILLYRRIQLQEAPTPLVELTAPNKPRINPAFFLVISAFVALGAVLMLFIRPGKTAPGTSDIRSDESSSSSIQASTASTNSPAASSASQQLPADARSLQTGDSFPFSVNGKAFRGTVESISNGEAVVKVMGTRYRILQGEERVWDFTGDSFSNLRLKILSAADNRIILLVPEKPVLIPAASSSSAPAAAATAPHDQMVAVKGKTLLKSDERVQIHLEIISKGLSQLNAVKDNNERSAHLLREGNKITLTAENSIQITATQPGNLSLNLNNVRLQINTRNPVAGFLFKWRRNPADGKYHLEYERVR